jgi:hypothetical protein
VGRHTAEDGSGVHPVVAAALLQRPPEPAEDGLRHDSGQGGLGWPGDPAEGTGLGWPGGTEEQAVAPPPVGVGSEPARRRSLWQRLFVA